MKRLLICLFFAALSCISPAAFSPSHVLIYAESKSTSSSISPHHELFKNPVTLHCVVKDSASSYSDITASSMVLWNESAFGKLEIKWYKVEPYMTHNKLKGNDSHYKDFKYYANAHWPFCSANRGWIGFDTLEYMETELKEFRNQWSIKADAHPTDKTYDRNDGMGVMRYRVSVETSGKKLSSPGLEAKDNTGIKNSVFTITLRCDDSMLGWITSYFNVPGIFGSVEKQVDGYTGVDCADLIMAGYNKSRKENNAYTNVGGMLKYMKTKTSYLYLFNDGIIRKGPKQSDNAVPLTYGKDVYAGDVMFYDYPPYGSWDHIGAIFMDADKNGVLNGNDMIIHAGFEEPHISGLSSSSFVAEKPTRIIIGHP